MISWRNANHIVDFSIDVFHQPTGCPPRPQHNNSGLLHSFPRRSKPWKCGDVWRRERIRLRFDGGESSSEGSEVRRHIGGSWCKKKNLFTFAIYIIRSSNFKIKRSKPIFYLLFQQDNLTCKNIIFQISSTCKIAHK